MGSAKWYTVHRFERDFSAWYVSSVDPNARGSKLDWSQDATRKARLDAAQVAIACDDVSDPYTLRVCEAGNPLQECDVYDFLPRRQSDD